MNAIENKSQEELKLKKKKKGNNQQTNVPLKLMRQKGALM